MTFSSSPEWVNLDECTDFVDCVNKIRRCNWGMNTNFYKALQLILDAIVRNKMSASACSFSTSSRETGGFTLTQLCTPCLTAVSSMPHKSCP